MVGTSEAVSSVGRKAVSSVGSMSEDYTPAYDEESGYYRPDEYYDEEEVPISSYNPGFARSKIQPLTSAPARSNPSDIMDEIYQSFANYLGNVRLSIYKEPNQGYITYGCRIMTGMMVEARYLFASVRVHGMYPRDCTLSQLNWVNLQFRTMESDLNLQENMGRADKKYLPYEMTAERPNRSGYPYIGPLPIRVTILRKDNMVHSYPDRLELYKIVDTWNCSVDLL